MHLMQLKMNWCRFLKILNFNSSTSNLTDYILPDEELINEILDMVDADAIESF